MQVLRSISTSILSYGLLTLTSYAHAQTPLKCQIGVSAEWQSSWCDLRPAMEFHQGTCMELDIGGKANHIVVRILEQGQNPDDPVGMVGETRPVPPNRKVIIRTPKDYPKAVQIAVHGGNMVWFKYYNDQNGAALLNSVTIIECPQKK